jgi:hypothetical protein
MNNDPVVFQLCPSLGKACGIYRYSLYVQSGLHSEGISCRLFRSCHDLDRALLSYETSKPIVLVQHEYGLFDLARNSLSGPDTTSRVISWLHCAFASRRIHNAAFIMHTLVNGDPFYDLLNKQLFSSGFTILHLNRKGATANCIEYLDHGVPVLDQSPLSSRLVSLPTSISVGNRTVAAFGMLTPNKLPRDILEICRTSGWNLKACFASKTRSDQLALRTEADRLGVVSDFNFEFLEESEILRYLSTAAVAIAIQDRHKHTSTSGSIRLLMNLGVPVLCNYCSQFDDVSRGTIRTSIHQAAGILSDFVSDEGLYAEQTIRLLRYVSAVRIGAIYAYLVESLLSSRSSFAFALDYTSCIRSSGSSYLSSQSPLISLDPLLNSGTDRIHIDLCLAMLYTGESRLKYICQSLHLSPSDVRGLAAWRLCTTNQFGIQVLHLYTLAICQQAYITWGLAEDIELLTDRPPSIYESLCSGNRLYTFHSLLRFFDHPDSDQSIYFTHVRDWAPWLSSSREVSQYIRSNPLNYEVAILPPAFWSFFQRSLRISTLIRKRFNLNSSAFLSSSDLLLRSTLCRLSALS